MSEITFTDSAIKVLRTTADRCQESTTLATCLVKLISMGGNVYAESDTMLICDTTSGMTVGMHFDGQRWSLHS